MKEWQWTVFFGDGSRLGSNYTKPEDVPPWNIQAIVQKDSPDSDTIVITGGDDFYYYDPEAQRWFGVELTGLVDYLVHSGFLKLGRFIPIEQYNRVMEKAMEEVKHRGK